MHFEASENILRPIHLKITYNSFARWENNLGKIGKYKISLKIADGVQSRRNSSSEKQKIYVVCRH